MPDMRDMPEINDAHERIIDQLSEYVDGELSRSAHTAIGEHIAGCVECRVIVGELQSVKERAAVLPNTPPRTDLWDGVAARLTEARTARVSPLRRRAARRFAFTMPQL